MEDKAMKEIPEMGTIAWKGDTISLLIRLSQWRWGGDEPLCRLWSDYLVKSSYLCVLLLEYLCVLCPTSLSPLGI